MGNCDNIKEKGISEREETDAEDLKLSDFKKLYPIGKGGFGRVWKVLYKRTKKVYAMKEMLKVKIFKKKSIQNVLNEIHIMETLNNEQLTSGIKFAFQTNESLYIITDYYPGGDLRYKMQKSKKKQFSEKEAKFIICNIILSLVSLRKKNIIHKDLKPENLIFDRKGYLHLIDFGLAQVLSEHNLSEKKFVEKNKSGTFGYMAPEVLMHKPQSFQVDYFALGLIAFELIFGKHPFLSHKTKNQKEIKEIILRKEIKISVDDLPNNTVFANPSSFCDFVNRLLQRKKNLRLGYKDIQEIVQHPWLSDFDWEKLSSGKMNSPFETDFYNENYEFEYSNQNEEIFDDDYYKVIKKINKEKLFNNFYYNIETGKTLVDFQNANLPVKYQLNLLTLKNNVSLSSKVTTMKDSLNCA